MWHDWVNYIAPNEFILAIMKVIKMNCIQESFALYRVVENKSSTCKSFNVAKNW